MLLITHDRQDTEGSYKINLLLRSRRVIHNGECRHGESTEEVLPQMKTDGHRWQMNIPNFIAASDRLIYDFSPSVSIGFHLWQYLFM
jgi:hypothetical protein